MDFNPLDILAAAALGEKDGPSQVKHNQLNRPVDCGSEGEDSKAVDECKDDKFDTNEEMGKITYNGLKDKKIDIKHIEHKMAPQKIDWSPEAFLTSHLDMSDKLDKFTLEELVNDLKKKNVDLELQKCVESSIIQNDLKHALNVDNSSQKTVSDINAINKDAAKNGSALVQETKEPVPEENVNTHSDIDSNESKSPELADTTLDLILELVFLDHTYSLTPGKTHCSSYCEDDDVDVDSDHSPLTEETEQRSRNLSLDFNYLKSGILEGVSASTLELYKMSGHSKLPSTSSSSSSPSADLLSKSPPYSDGLGYANSSTPGSSSPGPKFGKFKIGTLGSFSSGNHELEKYLRSKDGLNGKKLKVGIPQDTSCFSPAASPSIHPLPPSPCLDWDRSEASSEAPDDSSDSRTPLRLSPDITAEKATEWSHPIYHDHDYCVKTETKASEDYCSLQLGKRKYTKRKNDGMSHEKFMKAKYLKKELLKQDSFIKKPSDSDLSSVESPLIKSNPVGRPRKRPIEKIMDEEIDPETGTKLKITGKFQDQYVYYLSKTSRTTTRRRQTPLFASSSDRIIVPAPKPGDIVVPHLTDADIETVRIRGRSALNLPDRPHSSLACHLPVCSIPLNSSGHPVHSSPEFISDVDSHIVSTILSMENDNLASPTNSHVPDLEHSSELGSHQPSLSEGLRLVNGDSSITSEHVLNYLLSVVNGETLLHAASQLDSSGNNLFSDTMYPKSDQNDSANAADLLDIGKPFQCHFSNSNLSHKEIHNGYGNSEAGKDHMDDCVGLPDDLTSFMSASHGMSSSNHPHDSDSHASLKSMFGSDLSSLETSHLSSTVPRLTSIEKTLDYLGVRDDDIKVHSVYNTKPTHSHDESSEPLTPLSCTSDDTPWIVTVTLYFNDVPAIMINNQPYIRLVDIHKQILPAKDTGILKKRCQLLKIPVLNCTEMQRYFLVQYGRAYNSKSTLVVSKEQANHLVTYYAMPQPRLGRSEEFHHRRASSSGGSEGGAQSPVINPTVKIVRKRLNKGLKKTSAPAGSVEEPTKADIKESGHGNRTRHKKVNYLEMLKGEEKEKSSNASIIETIESVVKSAPLTVPECKANKLHLQKRKGEGLGNKPNGAKKRKILQVKKREGGVRSTGKQPHKGKLGKAEKQLLDHLSDVDSDVSDIVQSKKFKPLKLKVNSLINLTGQRKSASPSKKSLFSRSSSLVFPINRPVRVLAVAHQAALSGGGAESSLPSQPGDIHLDIFTKPNSACVRCETCSQFLSVPHFMRHHHVPIDSEWLASEAANRILVPKNKEKISEQEKLLWGEFHRLQESIGGFGETDDETDTDDGEYDSCMAGSNPLVFSSNTPPHRGKQTTDRDMGKLHTETSDDDDDSIDMDLPGSPEIEVKKFPSLINSKTAPHSSTTPYVPESRNTSHLRTSSRKKKAKQLFSIENYYTAKRMSTDDESLSSGNVNLPSRSRMSI